MNRKNHILELKPLKMNILNISTYLKNFGDLNAYITNGNDTINGTSGNDYIDGLSGNDVIYGNDGDDGYHL